MENMNKDELIQLWLDAEEENRNQNDEKCIEMKNKFAKEFDKLSKEDKQYVEDYLESCAA
jgi:hypothetical protein